MAHSNEKTARDRDTDPEDMVPGSRTWETMEKLGL